MSTLLIQPLWASRARYIRIICISNTWIYIHWSFRYLLTRRGTKDISVNSKHSSSDEKTFCCCCCCYLLPRPCLSVCPSLSLFRSLAPFAPRFLSARFAFVFFLSFLAGDAAAAARVPLCVCMCVCYIKESSLCIEKRLRSSVPRTQNTLFVHHVYMHVYIFCPSMCACVLYTHTHSNTRTEKLVLLFFSHVCMADVRACASVSLFSGEGIYITRERYVDAARWAARTKKKPRAATAGSHFSFTSHALYFV